VAPCCEFASPRQTPEIAAVTAGRCSGPPPHNIMGAALSPPTRESRPKRSWICFPGPRKTLPQVPPTTGSFHKENFVEKKLGAGSFASVYSVSESADATPKYAAKVVSLQLGHRGASREAEEMVSVEWDILRKVAVTGSDHIVKLHRGFREGSFVYMVMEKCDDSLRHALGSMEVLTEETYKPLLRGMLNGLQLIHKLGIVHRDVKPENFMCSGRGSDRIVKLCDFGLSDMTSTPGARELRGVKGTAPYIAPEMLSWSRYTALVDTWSFGVIVYSLFFGHFPYFPEERPTARRVKRAIRRGVPAPAFAPRVYGFYDEDFAGAVSQVGTDFVGALLRRCPQSRLTAADALKHRFFESGPVDDPAPSLKPMLRSAEIAGAFGSAPRYYSSDEEPPTATDLSIAAMQVEQGHDSQWTTMTFNSVESTGRSMRWS